jgi:hypothetical protein
MSRGKTNTNDDRATLAGAATEGERRPGLRALGGSVAQLAAPVVARDGGLLARLKANWPAIIGAELAAATWPAGLSRDGVLKLRVAPERALEIQHRVSLVIERTNLFFGRDAVARIVLVQGPLPLASPPRQSRPAPLSAEERRALDGQLAGVSDPELREALTRLGRSVMAAARRNN